MNKFRFFEFSNQCCGFNWFMLLCTFLALTICIAGCNTAINKHPHELSTLPKLSEPTYHYLELKKIDSREKKIHSEMDSIYFPDQVNKLLLKSIRPQFLTKAELVAFVPNLKHPSNSSSQVRAELDFLLELQENRTAEMVEEALRWHEIVYFPIIGMKSDEHLFFEAFEIYGNDFDPDKFPKTRILLNNIMKEMRFMEFSAKNSILRPRPRQLESRLEPLKKMSSSSFVSGHTLWAYMHAYLLASLDPTKAEAYLELAYRIGYSREILGVHYPSDEEAARKLAYQILSKMWERENFQSQLIKAAREWRK